MPLDYVTVCFSGPKLLYYGSLGRIVVLPLLKGTWYYLLLWYNLTSQGYTFLPTFP